MKKKNKKKIFWIVTIIALIILLLIINQSVGFIDLNRFFSVTQQSVPSTPSEVVGGIKHYVT